MTIETLTDSERKWLENSTDGHGLEQKALRCVDQRDAALAEARAAGAILSGQPAAPTLAQAREQALSVRAAAEHGLRDERQPVSPTCSNTEAFLSGFNNGCDGTDCPVHGQPAAPDPRDAEIARVNDGDSCLPRELRLRSEVAPLKEALAAAKRDWERDAATLAVNETARAEAAEQKLTAAEKSRLEWRADVIEWRARAEAAEHKLAAEEERNALVQVLMADKLAAAEQKLAAAERKAESWERGHDYAWELKVAAEARVRELEGAVNNVVTDAEMAVLKAMRADPDQFCADCSYWCSTLEES